MTHMTIPYTDTKINAGDGFQVWTRTLWCESAHA